MGASYKKLWKLLIDRDLLKRDLRERANFSPSTMAKLGRGESVNMDILLRICKALDCDIADIVEVVPDDPSKDTSVNSNKGDSEKI